MDVHRGKNLTVDFECGLCDHKEKTFKNCKTHICDSESCPFTGKTLKSIEINLKKKYMKMKTQM